MSSGPGRDYNWSPFQIDDSDDYATLKAKHAALLDILQVQHARLRLCETTGSPSLVPGSGIDFVDYQVFNSEMPEAAPGSLFTGSRSPSSPPQTRECGGHSSPRRAGPGDDLEPERKTRSRWSGEKREHTHLSAGTGNQASAPRRKRGRVLEETSGHERDARWATSLGAVHHSKALEIEHAAPVEGRPLEQGPLDTVPSGARATDRNAITTDALTMGRSAPGFLVHGGVQRTPLGVPAPLPQVPNPDVTEFRTPCVPRLPAPGLSAVRGARTGNLQGVPRSFLPSGIPTDLPSNSVGGITSSALPQPTANPAGHRRYMQLDLLRPAAPVNPADSPDLGFVHATDHPGLDAKAISCNPRSGADVHLQCLVYQPSAPGATPSTSLVGHGKEQTAPVAVIPDHAPAAEDIPVRTQTPAESSSGFWGSAKMPSAKGHEGVPQRTVARPQPPQGLQRVSGKSLGVKLPRKPAASPPWRSKRKAAAPPKHLRGLRREPPGVGRQRRGILVPLVNSVVDECSVGEADLALIAYQEDVENRTRVLPIPALHQDPDDHYNDHGQPNLGTHHTMLPDPLPDQGDGSAFLAPGPDMGIQPESLAHRQTLSSESVGMPVADARSLPSPARSVEASIGARPLQRQPDMHSHDEEASLDLGVGAVPPATEVNGIHSPLPAHESSGASLQMVPDTLLPMSQAVLYLDSGLQQLGNRTEPHSACRREQGAAHGHSSGGTPLKCPAQVVGDDTAQVPPSPDLGLCATIPDTPPSDPRENPASVAPGPAGHIRPLPLDFGAGATRLPQEGSPPLLPMDDDTVPESDPGEVLFPALAPAQNPTASPALVCQPNLSAAQGFVGARKVPRQCESMSTRDNGPCAPTPSRNPPGNPGVGGPNPPPWSQSPQRSGGTGPAPSQQIGGSLGMANVARTASGALPELGTLVEVVPLTPAESGPREDSTGDPYEQASPSQKGNLQDGFACTTRDQAMFQDPSSNAAVALPGVTSTDNPSSAPPVQTAQPKPDSPTEVGLPSPTIAKKGVSTTTRSHYEGTGVDISGILPANAGAAPVADEGVPLPKSPAMPSAFADEETAAGPASLAPPHQMPAGGATDRSGGPGEVSDRGQHARNTAPTGEAAAEERPKAREPPAPDLVCRAGPHDCIDPRPDGSTAGVRSMQPSAHDQEPSLVPAHGAGTSAIGVLMEVGSAGQLVHNFLPSHEPQSCQETHDLVPPTLTFDRVEDQRYSHYGSHDLMPPGLAIAHGQGTDTVPCRAVHGQTGGLMRSPGRGPGGEAAQPTRESCGQLQLNGEQKEGEPAAFSYPQGQAGHTGRVGPTELPQPALGSSYAGGNIRSLFTTRRRAAVPEVGGSLARTGPQVPRDKDALPGDQMPAQAPHRLAQSGILRQAEDGGADSLPGHSGATIRAWRPGTSRFEGLEVPSMSHQGECSRGQTNERHTGPANAHKRWGLPNQTHGQAVTSMPAPPPKDDCILRSDRMQGPPHQDPNTRLANATFGETRSVATVEGIPHRTPNRQLAKARFGEAHRLARAGTPEVDVPLGDGHLNRRHIPYRHDPAVLAGPDCAQPAMGLTKPPHNSSANVDDDVGCLDLRMPNPVTGLAFSTTGRFLAVLMSEGGGDARTILVWLLGQPPGEHSATPGPPICVGEITGHVNRSLFPGQCVSESSALQVMDLGETAVVLSAATLPLVSASKSTPMPNGVTAYDMRQHLPVSLPTAHATCCVLLDHDGNLFTSGVGPNVTYWTADAKLLEPHVPSNALPKAAIQGETFLDVVCLSATRGLLLGCSSAGQVAIWDVMRAQLLMAGSPPVHSSVPAVLTAIPALDESAAFLMLAIPKDVVEPGTLPLGHPAPSGSCASILLHLQQTGGLHQDSFLAGKAIVMAGDSKGCAAIADRYGGVLLWRDGRHVKSLRLYGKRITALAVANGQVACASRSGRVLCYNLNESFAAAYQ